jgi:hypothetical protein
VIRWTRIDPDEPITIRSYRYAYAAELARLALEAASVPCAVLSDTYSEVMSSGARVAVRRRDADRAREALG